MRKLEHIPTIPAFLSHIARLWLRLMGWTLVDETPDVPKLVFIAAPHTANVDTFIMILAAFGLRVRLNFLVKNTLTFPANAIVRFFGGIPIDRKGGLNLVEQVAQIFAAREKLFLGIAPEGTRKKVTHWKTGFYYIALKAQVPIAFGFIDYGTKRTGCCAGFLPTGDIRADFARIHAFYDGMKGLNPENFTNATLPADLD